MIEGHDAGPDHAVIDREGRLASASARLHALHRAAGGVEGGELAIPQLAALARLARTLNAPVSRRIVTAKDDGLLSAMASARVNGTNVDLSVSEWAPHVQETGLIAHRSSRDAGFATLEEDGGWQCDRRLIVTSVSPVVAAMAGRDLVGLPLLQAFRLQEDGQGDLPLVQALAEQLPFYGQPVELRQGDPVRLVLHGTPIESGQDGFSGFSGGLRLADRALAARIRPRRETDIAAVSAFQERLNGALRTPLARIIANADSVAAGSDGPLGGDYINYARDISSAGRHLLRLADDLNDLQAVERPDFRIELQPIDLADIARRAAGLLSVRAIDRDVRIDTPDSTESLPALGDFGRALQILVNLIGNAVRYSPRNAMVWVRSEIQDDLAAVIVADLGKGIAIEDQDRIFEKFHRVDPTEPHGSGLGLYISRKLARAMGGDISVDSAPGQGARFILTLPQKQL